MTYENSFFRTVYSVAILNQVTKKNSFFPYLVN
jgi:hypothetical protein